MPNHVTNLLTVDAGTPEKSKELLDNLLDDDNNLDFEKLIPMPDGLRNFTPHSTIELIANAELDTPLPDNPLLAALRQSNRENYANKEVSPEDRIAIDQFKDNVKTCGYGYWYDWRIANWGTKWNSYDGERVNDNTIRFDTAWSIPMGIYEKLEEMYPDVKFNLQFADEDLGSNCGTIHFGNCTEFIDVSKDWCNMSKDEQRKWCKFAFELRYPGQDPSKWGYDENFNYIEE